MLICPTVCVTVKQTLTVHLVCSTATPTTQQSSFADIEKWIEKFALISCAIIAYATCRRYKKLYSYMTYISAIHAYISDIYLSAICHLSIHLYLQLITHATQPLVGHSHLTHTSLAIRKCLATATSTAKVREGGEEEGRQWVAQEGECSGGQLLLPSWPANRTQNPHRKLTKALWHPENCLGTMCSTARALYAACQ